MTTQYGFNETTFNQALARARAVEAAELAAVAAGVKVVEAPRPLRATKENRYFRVGWEG